MKSAIAFLLFLTAVCGFSSGQEKQEPDFSRFEEAARKFVTLLSEGKHEDAAAMIDESVKKQIPPEKLKEAWSAAIERFGPFKEIVSVRNEMHEDRPVSFVSCKFEKGGFDVKVAFVMKGGITGFFYVPTRKEMPYKAPSYVDQSAFEEKELRFGAEGWELPATLALPKGEGPFPAIVLVHGSGPNDRDETIGPNKPFKDIAWGLASSGVAVLRYDKRTLVHGSRMVSMNTGAGALTINEETVDDAVLAAELMAKTPGVDKSKVFILGHSLGGMMIPRIAKRCPSAAGFVVLAGAARPLEDLILDQYAYIYSLDGSVSETEKKNLERLKEQAARAKDPSLSPDTPPGQLPLGCPARYWIDLRTYRPAEEAASIEKPVLVLQGERDYQVTMEDFALWRKGFDGRSNAVLKSYPALNHCFMHGKGKATPMEYTLPLHVSKEVISDLAEFILTKR